MQFHSQLGQDRFVYETFFKNRTEPGVYVDIGAYDGVDSSNTLFFERLGWTGICIEPLPEIFEKLRAARKAVCLNCAVSDSAGSATFCEVEGPPGEMMHSGLRANYHAEHLRLIAQHAKITRTFEIPVRTLKEILDENKIRKIDYLSIDTEGSEWKILRNFDLKSYEVSVISIENNFKETKVRNHLIKQGFKLIKIFAGYDELYAKLNSN
jgi:FkbM family methyltransferase